MKTKILLTAFAFCLAFCAAPRYSYAGETEMNIVTNEGYVTFTVDDDWLVLGTQPKMPVATFAYQIQNSADEETPHSTNLVIKLFQNDAQTSEKTHMEFGKKIGEAEPAVKTIGDWTVYTQTDTENDVPYTIMDAVQKTAHVTICVRLAWPHLPNNAQDYNQAMEKIFNLFVDSISSKNGTLTPPDNAVIRRPEQ